MRRRAYGHFSAPFSAPDHFSAPMLGGIGGIFGISRDGITFVSMPYSCIGGERRSDQTYDRSERLLPPPDSGRFYTCYIDAARADTGFE